MKRYSGIDYDFRPDTCWSAADPLALILGHVKGTNRRQMIRDYWEAGVLKDLDDQLLQDTLTEAERQRLGRIHPSFMGGEHLPDFKAGEEEIVRVELASTTSDVISGGDAAELRHFTRVESSFYPELSEHYENAYDDWVEEHTPAGVSGEDDEGDGDEGEDAA